MTVAVTKWRAEVYCSVPFYDLDPVGIVWHGHYAKYFERARCALLEQINYGYDAMRASGYLWPVIDLHVRYLKPLTFGQQVKVTATLSEWEYRLKCSYLIQDANTGMRLTKGTTTQVAVDVQTKEMLLTTPRVLRECLKMVAGVGGE